MNNIKNVLIIFNNNFYKEIDIDSYETDEMLISNKEEDDIYLNIDVNMSFNVCLKKTSGYWEIIQGENTYLVINGIKVLQKKLLHGDQVSIKLDNNKIELFKINFFIDFASGKENYDKEVSIVGCSQVSFGRDVNNDISIFDDLVDINHCKIEIKEDNAQIIDLNSRYSVYINGKKINGTSILNDNDFIIICGYKFLFKEDRILLSNYNNKIKINGLKIISSEKNRSKLNYPEFIRNSRYMYNLPSEEVEIIEPPKKEQKPTLETFVSVIPTIGMVIISLSIGNRSNPYYYIGMCVVTILATVIMFVIKSIKVRRSLKDRNKKYLEYLKNQENKIKEQYSDQIRISKILFPESEKSIEIVNRFNHRLWEKSITDEDFLTVSLGSGCVPVSFNIKIPSEKWGETEDELIMLPRKCKEKYEKIQEMPITLDLKNEVSSIILGHKEYVNNFLRNIIIQLVTYHYYEDLKIVLICDEEDIEKWKWMRWLPHVWSEDKKIRFISKDKESAHNILSVLADYFEKRNEIKEDENIKPYFIIFVTKPELLNNEKASLFLQSRNTKGLTTVFLYDDFQKTPNNCTSIIKLNSANEGELCNFSKAEEKIDFKYNVSNMADFEAFARRIAPIYVKKQYSAESLKKCITFFELYGVNSSREIPIIRNWKNNMAFKHIAAPLGIDTAGNIIALDLHEKYHGPHGLVAGTTGSGKSELLQSLILSLAVNYHPHDINFILIDYKGGGMANLFKNLPHLVGTITNLDGAAINRSLIAINSELKRRQKIFGDNNVNHIDQYIELYKDGKVKEPIPHLIMIADEFAELKRDQPEFMKELVSTARIGRSLGVHLILATQKPAGVVDSQIWSNSKFKLCLKVQDANDSKEVIKNDLAAKIVEPGRAYLQVGNNEIFELFQSAWSGAEISEDSNIQKNDIEISKVSIEGIRKVIFSSKEENKNKNLITQLEETIKVIKIVANRNNIIRLKGPWLEELKQIIFLKDLLEKYKNVYQDNNIIKCSIGEIDDPEIQSQYLLDINFTERGNVLIVGAPGYGKTTMLQTMITSLIEKYTAKDINIYVLDFGTRTLKIFEKAPQVGGVILQNDEEKLNRFYQMIRKEIDYRKNLFSNLGVASLKAYKEAGNNELPHIVIVVDNYIALKELYEITDEQFAYLSREGLTLGITLVVATASYSNLRYKISSNFNELICLTCNERSEYSSMFGTMRVAPGKYKGRVLIKRDRILDGQIALVGSSESDTDRVKAIEEIIANLKENAEYYAKAIPFMPDVLKFDVMANRIKKSSVIPLGISYDNLEEKYIDLDENPILTIIGQPKMGKSTFIKNVVKIMNNQNCITYVFDSLSLGLRELNSLNNIHYTQTNGENEKMLIDELLNIANNRENEYSKKLLEENIDENTYLNSISRILIVIDNVKDFLSVIQILEKANIVSIAKKCINTKINIIASFEQSGFSELMYADNFVKKLKEVQTGLLFEDIESQKGFDITLKYGRKKIQLSKGQAYFIKKGKYELFKIPE